MRKSTVSLMIMCFAVSLLAACDQADNDIFPGIGPANGFATVEMVIRANTEPIGITTAAIGPASEATPSSSRIIHEKGVYYILCDGADESSKPNSSVTDGNTLIILVEKCGYTSVGPFDNSGEFMEEVKKQCDYMVDENYLTQGKAEQIMKAAAKIQISLSQSGDTDKTSNDKTDATYDEEYAQWGIQARDGAHYHQNERIRIFMDLRANNSFVNFYYDKSGSVDLRLVRDSGGSIVKSEYISKDEASEILSDLDAFPLTVSNKVTTDALEKTSKRKGIVPEDIVRQTIEELPGDVQIAIDSCNNETWYVIDGRERRYIYYGNLPYNYAYQYEPGKNQVIVVDIGNATGNNYVLLSVPLNSDLTINYNSKPVTYTKVAL